MGCNCSASERIMKQTLQLKLSQQLTLTPQLQQSIRLLQLSTLDLNQEVERFLQENPMLEREDEPGATGGGEGEPEAPVEFSAEPAQPEMSTSAETPENDVPSVDEGPVSDWPEDFSGGNGARDDEDNDYQQMTPEQLTLRQHLLSQLGLTQLSEHDKRLVELLIDALDDDGYLSLPLEELQAMLPEELEIDPVELDIALKHVQNMEPVGVGARSLAECLVLQIAALPSGTPYRSKALATVEKHLDLLAARDFTKLRKALSASEEDLRGIQQLITRLNPRPGAAYGHVETRYVVPDVIVKKVKGLWHVSLNPDAMPKLRVNRMYADILQRNRDASTAQLSSQLQEAKWLIKNVQQRFDTILRVSQAIVEQQQRFFEHGEVAMRPLVLREIAETLGLHESTVSRVTTQKYMFTPRGIFELKYFFGSHVETETGGQCSAIAIRALIKQLVSNEDSKKPLSDSHISEILAKQGIVVARRTIAKYRESLQIPPVNLRKSL